ncbi:MAG: ORF6N domain-containing protein [Candidatus Gastranaerophilales bacterium]|nr:ORF6N domain-containing protein [Candidatus Gastranaerophilales bacterium]
MEELTIATRIENKIFTIRGIKVMLDRDLAELYQVETKKLNQAVRRNIGRFPEDFMFRLSQEEWDNLRSHFVTANADISKMRYLPYAFTEHGVTMLSSVLRSKKAIEINIQVVRAFISLRRYAMLQTSKNAEIEELKKMLMLHIENTDKRLDEHEETIAQIINVLNNLIEQPKEAKPIGFKV